MRRHPGGIAFPFCRSVLSASLAVSAGGCVDTTVPYPANFPAFSVDEVASEVDASKMGDSVDAPPMRSNLKVALDKWAEGGQPRPARFRLVVDDNTDAITYVMFTILLPVTIVFAELGAPMGSATCSVDFTFDNGLVSYTSHHTLSYPIGIFYPRIDQHNRCVEKLAKLAIVEAATKGTPVSKAP